MNKVIYTKIAKERKKQFQICTKILHCGDKKEVVKEALYEEGKRHLEHMCQYALLYQFDDLKPITCRMENNKVVFPFVNGESLIDLLIKNIECGNNKKACQILLEYKNTVYRLGCDEREFLSCKEFEKVFGKVNGLENKRSGKFVNIDNILENILWKNNKYLIIDYEWFFDFYIPFDFVLFRTAVDLFTNYSSVMQEMFEFEELIDLFGIEETDLNTYYYMNMKFNDYVFDVKEGYNYNKNNYAKPKLVMEKYIQRNAIYAQLFYDKGSGFTEEYSMTKNISLIEYDNYNICKLKWNFDERDNIERLRFDPMNVSGYVEIISMTALNQEGQKIFFDVEDVNYLKPKLYLSNDPQIIVNLKDSGLYCFFVEMRVCPCVSDELNSLMNKTNMYMEHLKHNNLELQNYINTLI